MVHVVWKSNHEVLLDQCQRDPELKGKFSNQQSLLDGIIKALEDGTVVWPGKSNQVTREKWIEKMKIDMNFYKNFSRNAKEMEDYEYLLLEAAAHFLKRKIKLYCINSDNSGTPKVFNANGSTKFYLLCCNNIRIQNFFLSLTKEARKRKRDACKVS